MKKKIMPVLVAVSLIIIVAVIGVVNSIIAKYTPSNEKMDVNKYFGLTQKDEVALVLKDKVLEEKGLLINGVAYIDQSVVKTYLNNRFYWDTKEKICVYTTPTDMIIIPAESKDYKISQKAKSESYVIVKVVGDKVYLAADFVKRYTDMECQNFTTPNRMVINYQLGNNKMTALNKDDSLRYQGGIKSPILTNVKQGESVKVVEQMEDWSKIMTAEGYIGYVKNDRLSDTQMKNTPSSFVQSKYTSIKKDYKINLVWHQITNEDSNASLLKDIAEMKGVNTISPTWFSIANNDGKLTSLASADYVNQAHEKGLEVWALIDNFSQDIDTTTVLGDTKARQHIIKQLISSADTVGFDGINVDLESIPEAAADGYIQFIRELSIQCRKKGLVLSIDDPVPQPYTIHYNRKEQGIVADYVIIMGYDEHYLGSEEAGSVSSISFVKSGIEETLAKVPKDKVINGIPFYTRLWKTVTNSNATTELTGEAMGMDEANQVLADNNVKTAWDQGTMQDYAEYTGQDGAFYQIWLENEKSIEEKMKLIQKFQLGGVAAWKLGFERSSIWNVIQKYVGK